MDNTRLPVKTILAGNLVHNQKLEPKTGQSYQQTTKKELPHFDMPYYCPKYRQRINQMSG